MCLIHTLHQAPQAGIVTPKDFLLMFHMQFRGRGGGNWDSRKRRRSRGRSQDLAGDWGESGGGVEIFR